MVQFYWMLRVPLPHGGAGTVFSAGVPSGLYSGQAGFCFFLQWNLDFIYYAAVLILTLGNGKEGSK